MSYVVEPRTGLRCTSCPEWEELDQRGALNPLLGYVRAQPNSVVTVERPGFKVALCRSHVVSLLGADWRKKYDIPEQQAQDHERQQAA